MKKLLCFPVACILFLHVFCSAAPLILLQSGNDIQTPDFTRNDTLTEHHTHRSRAAEKKLHAFHNSMELAALVVVKTSDNRVAARAVTPSRVSNGAISYSLEEHPHNVPFIRADEATVVLLAENSRAVSELVRRAAEHSIYNLTEDDQATLSFYGYESIELAKSKIIPLSSNEAPVPGDRNARYLFLGNITTWQVRDSNAYLGYSQGQLVQLSPSKCDDEKCCE